MLFVKSLLPFFSAGGFRRLRTMMMVGNKILPFFLATDFNSLIWWNCCEVTTHVLGSNFNDESLNDLKLDQKLSIRN